ncbi:MAG: hypothetical protein DMF27_10365 [Verrucomicrobia bacterium]|nr:MAG: hypothetical protein DME37_02380 [Verrucomicrobiota bacterium]PYL75992.1 MAG: hypothetical protein DMF27_10365 [Verrucomicrobiota bacterium]PYM09900.1 MAG: hypothetical protein DMF15_04030 [Verrucomicrobiota bacterium]
MAEHSDLYRNTYSQFNEHVLEIIRKETFGVDIGQNSWLTVDEYDRFVSWLRLMPESHLLEVATGSGGPALYLAKTIGCRVTGVDANKEDVTTASRMAGSSNQTSRVCFTVADANARLPFDDNSFDAVLCIDAMNHLPARLDQTQHGRAPAQRAQFDYGAVDSDSSGNRRKPRHCRARDRWP